MVENRFDRLGRCAVGRMICVPDGATHSQGPNFTEEPGLGKAAGPRPTPTGTNRHPEKDLPMSTTELPTDADSPVETPSPPVEEAVPADNADGDVPTWPRTSPQMPP